MAEEPSLILYYFAYSGLIAPTGQVAAQEPQSIHFSSITYCASPSEIASTGQTEAQAPHEIHSLLILYMKFTSYVDNCILLYYKLAINHITNLIFNMIFLQ